MNEEEKNAVEYSKNCLMKIAFGIDCEFDVNILEKLINLIDKLQEENEELKFKERSRIIGKYGDVEIHDLINRTLLNDYILTQKVKDKIEKYKNMCISNVKGYENYFKDNYDEVVYRRMEQLEKELLESEE